MKLTLFSKADKKKRSARRGYSDYYQNRLNTFGREQMEALARKGISISW